MNIEPLVSVIVPIYNVENYVNQCVVSILNQTYKSLEIILVDDGSTDESGEICDHFSESDKRVITIHKENGGLSDARNAGLKRAGGKYVMFVDGDDSLHPLAIETLYNNMIRHKARISGGVAQQKRKYRIKTF